MEETPEDVITCAKEWIVQHGAYKYGPPIQALMDTVSGVHNYRMASSTDQGFIYRKLLRSRLEHNHIVDVDTMISKFWYGAIQAVLKARPAGAVVEIKNGTGEAPRKTNMPPLTYIRNMGVAAARKYIDECCRSRLKQLCHDCQRITSLGKQREIDPGCKCGAKESINPQAFVRSRKRVCIKCGTSRVPMYERVCGTIHTDPDTGEQWIPAESGCGSSNITIIQSEEFVDSGDRDAWEWKFGLTDTDPESDVAEAEITRDAADFANACIEALPPDLSDPNGDSKTRKILRVLVDPREGVAICAQCRETDPDSCGAQAFDLSECINYSKKLGQYFGYSTTLANRRVKKIRTHTFKFAVEHQDTYLTAKYIARKLSEEQDSCP